jgi:acetyl esterase/lipase
MIKNIAPLAIADGLAAVDYVRQHASQWGISPDHVGIIGFSAGGFIAADVAVQYAPESRPAFVAVIYGGLKNDSPVPPDAPPTFNGESTA